MNFLVLAFVFELPAGVAAGGLRALKRPPVLQPLQRPPPATADVVFAQLDEAYARAPGPAPGAPAPGPMGSPAGGPGPAPGITMPPPPQLASITAGSCMGLQNVVAQIVVTTSLSADCNKLELTMTKLWKSKQPPPQLLINKRLKSTNIKVMSIS